MNGFNYPRTNKESTPVMRIKDYHVERGKQVFKEISWWRKILFNPKPEFLGWYYQAEVTITNSGSLRPCSMVSIDGYEWFIIAKDDDNYIISSSGPIYHTFPICKDSLVLFLCYTLKEGEFYEN